MMSLPVDYHDLDHAEIGRLAQEVQQSMVIAEFARKNGDKANHHGATAAGISAFLRMADELNHNVQEMAR